MSKKILLGSLLALVLAPTLVMAVSEVPDSCYVRRDVSEYITDCETANDNCSYDTTGDTAEPCALCCLMATVLFVSDIAFGVVMSFVIIFTLIGAFFILTSGDNPERATKGRDYIKYAFAGLVVAILARAMPALISYFIGGGGSVT